MPKRLDHVIAAKEEALKLGATFIVVQRSKHLCGLIGFNGKSRKVFISVSPSDHCAIKNIREDVRRKIREME